MTSCPRLEWILRRLSCKDTISMERRIGRFLFTSYALTVLLGLCIGEMDDKQHLIQRYCAECKESTGTCRIVCNANGKRSALSEGFNTGGYGIFQVNPYKQKNDYQQCPLLQLYNLLPTECSETLDLLVELARRGIQD